MSAFERETPKANRPLDDVNSKIRGFLTPKIDEIFPPGSKRDPTDAVILKLMQEVGVGPNTQEGRDFLGVLAELVPGEKGVELSARKQKIRDWVSPSVREERERQNLLKITENRKSKE
jgi:hypothetical protein